MLGKSENNVIALNRQSVRCSRRQDAAVKFQLSTLAPKAPAGSYDKPAFKRGKIEGWQSACHVPPLFTEPGHSLHTPEEMGVASSSESTKVLAISHTRFGKPQTVREKSFNGLGQ